MYKQVIVVRKDLKCGEGKLIAHSIHAAIGSMKSVSKGIIRAWEREGAKKVVLKVRNLEELEKIQKKIKAAKLPSYLVRDAGLTQLRPGTITALGIGPAEEKKIDKITGKLKLL